METVPRIPGSASAPVRRGARGPRGPDPVPRAAEPAPRVRRAAMGVARGHVAPRTRGPALGLPRRARRHPPPTQWRARGRDHLSGWLPPAPLCCALCTPPPVRSSAPCRGAHGPRAGTANSTRVAHLPALAVVCSQLDARFSCSPCALVDPGALRIQGCEHSLGRLAGVAGGHAALHLHGGAGSNRPSRSYPSAPFPPAWPLLRAGAGGRQRRRQRRRRRPRARHGWFPSPRRALGRRGPGLDGP